MALTTQEKAKLDIIFEQNPSKTPLGQYMAYCRDSDDNARGEITKYSEQLTYTFQQQISRSNGIIAEEQAKLAAATANLNVLNNNS